MRSVRVGRLGIMKNLITKTTDLAMHVTLAYINSGDTVVDATCGTGRDTAALARAVGEDGRVFAFDVQDRALELTEARLRAEGLFNVRLLKQSFVFMGEHVPEKSAAAAVFNLGYLPGGDHRITTTADSTIEGLHAALRMIRPGGVVTIVLYDGHENGREEKRKVLAWAETLDARDYHVVFGNMLNQANHPPEILWITKKHSMG